MPDVPTVSATRRRQLRGLQRSPETPPNETIAAIQPLFFKPQRVAHAISLHTRGRSLIAATAENSDQRPQHCGGTQPSCAVHRLIAAKRTVMPNSRIRLAAAVSIRASTVTAPILCATVALGRNSRDGLSYGAHRIVIDFDRHWLADYRTDGPKASPLRKH
ncbi:hypothetical protein FGIG_04162 [Fasciola gigantica]|uniref:Uncharacterized protein n=1 Tax=Fasciola gigantica TaxID=46835 RepID=A0A504YT56_FASGI|nr:hypothetical protein FGIG_04162 [Fasciola gigantica]